MTPKRRAFLAPEPFTPRSIVLEVAEGLTIAGILLEAVRREELPLEDLARVAVYVDGVSLEEELGREAMLDFVPPPGVILNVAVETLGGGGGGGGGKNPLQTILTIAIIAASFWVSGGAATPAGFFDKLIVRTALAAAVNVGGQMAISAAFSRDGDGMKEASDRRALEGASNQFRLRESFPLQLGEERVAADMAASPYTQNIGDDTYLHVALAWHYGEARLEDMKIGETLLADYPAGDVQVEHFLTPGPRESYLFPGSVKQENFTDELDFAAGGVWEVHTAQAGSERIEVDVTLPNGLKYNADSGKLRNEEVAGQIQYAEVGTEVWVGAPFPGYNTTRDKNNVLLPAGSWYLNLRTNDAVRNTYGWTVPDKTKQYKVRVKAYDRDGDYPNEEGRTWSTYWSALRSITRTRPVVDQNLAVTFMRIRSSDDLNGNLPTVTARVTPIVPIWSGGNWNTKAPTSNQAALARWLMTGPAAAQPLRTDQIDASCATAYSLIEANGWGAAVQIRDEASQQDALIRLGRAGRFATYWNGRRLCFVTDWQKPAPRQVFTGRNAEGYRYRRSFPDPIHAVIVEFRDPDSASVAGETIVYADGYTAATAELFETLRLDYSCSIERAFKEGRAYLAKRSLLVESHEWEAGVDSIATTFGDRVLVRHWSNLYGEAEARVDYRHWQGALVAGVRLDDAVTMVEGEAYALDFRRADGVIRNLPLSTVAGTSRTVMFAAPRAADISPGKGDLVVFGRVNLVTEDVEVVDIEPSSDMRATIRAVRYIGEELVAAETGPIPPLVSGITPRPSPPIPRVIGSTGSPAGVTVAFELDPVRGALLDSTAVRWRRSAEGGAPENQWSSLPPLASADRQVRTPPILDAVSATGDASGEYRVDIELRTVLKNGSVSDPAYALDVLVVREVLAPTGVTALGATRTGPDGSTYPVLALDADPIEAGDIQDLVVEVQRTGSAAWVSAGQPLPSRNPVGDFTAVSGGASYLVRARWRTQDGWLSPWVQTTDPVAIPAGRISTDTTHVGGRPSDTILGQVDDLADGLIEANALIADAAAEIDDLFLRLDTPTTGIVARLGAAETAIVTNNSATVTRLRALDARANTEAPALNLNPQFGDFPTTPGLPSSWVLWNGPAGNFTRVAGMNSSRNAVNVVGPAGGEQGFAQYLPVDSIRPSQWVVITGEVELVSGTFAGSGVLWTEYDNAITGYQGDQSLILANQVDQTGATIGAGTVGRRVRFSVLFQTGAAVATERGLLYAMTHYSSFGSVAVANAVKWHELLARPATTAEIELRQARAGSGTLGARIGLVETATVNLETSKASATRVSILEANYQRSGSMNANPTFGADDWTSPALPLGWYALQNPAMTSRVAGGRFSKNVVRTAAPANTRVEFSQDSPSNFPAPPPGWYVLEVSLSLVSGSWRDSEVDLSWYDAGYVNLLKQVLVLPGVQPDIYGVSSVNGVVGKVARFAVLFEASNALHDPATDRLVITPRASFPRYNSPTVAGTMDWHQVELRPATATEIETRQARGAASSLGARVALAESATASLEGRVEASSTLLVTAGNRVSGVRYLAVDNADQSYGSIDFLADVLRVWSPDQTIGVAPFEIRGGTVHMRDAVVDRLAVGTSILVGARRLAVAFQPFSVQATDSVPVSYGTSIGLAPDLVFLRDGAIQQPGSGESFDFYADTPTGTGFTPRLKIKTAAAPTNQTAGPGGSSSDGTAEHYFTLAAAASGNSVSVRVTGIIQSVFYNDAYNPGGPPVADDGTSYSDGYMQIAVFGYAGGWTQIGTLDIYPNYRDQNTAPGTYNDSFDTGLTAFAVSPTTTRVGVAVAYETFAPSSITDLRLAYQTAGSSGVRTATPNGELTTVMVYPKNSL